MCAIAGILNLPYKKDYGNRMLRTMRRRGPDGSGIFTEDDCTLLHTRLAIIDPEGGAQPMTLTYAGETYVITYNGELYNTGEIRSALAALGHTFLGHSDTEVVLHAYAQWKEDALPKFNGIFAFGIWETKKKRLFLARDRIGVKPLFYCKHRGGLLFASELKTLLAYPGVEACLDAQGAAELLLLGPGRTPGCGVLQGMEELKAGHYACYWEGRLDIECYWRLRDREHTHSFTQTAEHVRDLVCDAIRRQTVSDVPIGTFLSGGLDSSLITAVCAKAMEEKGERLHAFSLDHLDNDKYFKPGKFQPSSDNAYIRIMTQALDIDHTWTVLSPQELVEQLPAATEARDLPGMADVDFSLLALCSQIRKHVKVALSGECADEIFGGYPWFTDPQVQAVDGFPWAQNTKYRASFLRKDILEQLDPHEYVYQRYAQTVADADVLPEATPQERRMKQMMHLNMQWFMQTLLDRKDRMSMFSGLEVRVPFCDWRIAEYLYGVPWEFKYYRQTEKGLLRKAMEGLLPDEVLWRKKSPYPKTHDPLYLELVSEQLRQVLDDRNAPIHSLVEKDALESLLTAEYTWPWYGQLMKVPQTVSYMLQLNHWLKAYHVRIL